MFVISIINHLLAAILKHDYFVDFKLNCAVYIPLNNMPSEGVTDQLCPLCPYSIISTASGIDLEVYKYVSLKNCNDNSMSHIYCLASQEMKAMLVGSGAPSYLNFGNGWPRWMMNRPVMVLHLRLSHSASCRSKRTTIYIKS